MTKNVMMSVLIKRINRVLHKRDEHLRVLRGDKYLNEMGRYFIIDFNSNLLAQHVDPVEIGHELGVLKPSEMIV